MQFRNVILNVPKTELIQMYAVHALQEQPSERSQLCTYMRATFSSVKPMLLERLTHIIPIAFYKRHTFDSNVACYRQRNRVEVSITAT